MGKGKTQNTRTKICSFMKNISGLFKTSKLAKLKECIVGKDEVQNTRAKKICSLLGDISGLEILELGPQSRPTFTKDEAKISFLDLGSKKELGQMYPEFENEMHLIPETNYVAKSDNYQEYVDRKFDLCIANHVIEHSDDIINWLVNIHAILKNDGALFLSIPDKKHSFDKYRQNTTIAHIITDYLKGGAWSETEHIVEIDILYDSTFVGKEMNVEKNLAKNYLLSQAQRKPWPGLHRHVFEAETFLGRVLAPILCTGFVSFEVIHCDSSVASYGEFYCLIKKGKDGAIGSLDLEQFLPS